MLYATNKEAEKELQELKDAIKALFETGKEQPQRIALSQCENVGISQGQLIWDYILPKWRNDYNEIIKNIEFFFTDNFLENDSDDYFVFGCKFFDDELNVFINAGFCFIEIPSLNHIIPILKLIETPSASPSILYPNLFRLFKEAILSLDIL